MEEYAREPCPYRIVDDCGGAFAMGCIGGGVFQAIKGFRNAPSGFSKRLVRKLYFYQKNPFHSCFYKLPVGQFDINKGTSSDNRWEFCSLGWYVQYN